MAFEVIEDRHAAVDKFKELVDDVNICMLVTTDDNGNVMSRPMATINVDDEGNAWFFTNEFQKRYTKLRRIIRLPWYTRILVKMYIYMRTVSARLLLTRRR